METATELNFINKMKYSTEDGFVEGLKNELKNNKVVHFYGVDTSQDLLKFYSGLTDQLGEILETDEDYESGNRNFGRWTDIQYDQKKEETFRHSNTRQPMHTDQAYTSFDFDVNFFFCVKQADVGGATTFFDSIELYEILEKYEPELLRELTNTEVIFDKGESERKCRKIIDRDENGLVLTWNYFRLSDKNSEETKAVAERFHQFLESKLVDGGLIIPLNLKEGECVFFQDIRVLHGRNSFYGHRSLMKGAFNFAKS